MASRMTMPRKKIGANESATLTGMFGAEVDARKPPPTARAAALPGESREERGRTIKDGGIETNRSF